MYPIPDFKEHDRNEVTAFMRQYPFVILIGQSSHPQLVSNDLVATHVPVLVKEVDGKLFLEGHMMRKTDHHLAFESNPEALVIFNGPHCYVSSSWYVEMSASTWNYMTVHARGKLEFLTDDDLVRVMRETTELFENTPDSHVTYDKLPKEYVDSMIKGIVAFRIEVLSLQNVFKLSQNRTEQSYRNIVKELQKRGGEDALVADEMEKRFNKVFPGNPVST